MTKGLCGEEESVGLLSAPSHSSHCEHVPSTAFRITVHTQTATATMSFTASSRPVYIKLDVHLS